jgi:hypothetical protein
MRKSANDAIIERSASLKAGGLQKNATQEEELNRGVKATIPKACTTVKANDLHAGRLEASPVQRSRDRGPNESFQLDSSAERPQP